MDALFALLNTTFMVHKNPSLCVGAGPHKTTITKSTKKPSQCNTSHEILLCMQITAMQTEELEPHQISGEAWCDFGAIGKPDYMNMGTRRYQCLGLQDLWCYQCGFHPH